MPFSSPGHWDKEKGKSLQTFSEKMEQERKTQYPERGKTKQNLWLFPMSRLGWTQTLKLSEHTEARLECQVFNYPSWEVVCKGKAEATWEHAALREAGSDLHGKQGVAIHLHVLIEGVWCKESPVWILAPMESAVGTNAVHLQDCMAGVLTVQHRYPVHWASACNVAACSWLSLLNGATAATSY